MITLRKASQRGPTDMGWLKSMHSFSFGGYHDPAHMGYGPLRVINDDRVAPGKGFAAHAHDNMEIISYVLDGGLAHKDSLGNGSIIRPGDVQRMSAGTGVTHSEYNASATDPVHFLQIWIIPNVRDIPPSYEQKHFSRDERNGQLRLIGSHDARDGAVRIHQDVEMYAALLDVDHAPVNYSVRKGRSAWIQIAQGEIELNGHKLSAGDGAAVTDETLHFSKAQKSEILLFDLAA
jgi:hypothetical protein